MEMITTLIGSIHRRRQGNQADNAGLSAQVVNALRTAVARFA